MNFLQINMPVTQSVTTGGKTKREQVGEVVIHVPSIAELITDAEQVNGKDNKPLFTDDGLPVYKDDMHNWLQDAIFASVKAQARNKLVPKTATLKDGVQIATNWTELTAESANVSGAHLVAIREVKALFAKWVATLGKTAKTADLLIGLFGNVESVRTADEAFKGKFAGYLDDFSNTLTADQQTQYTKYLSRLGEAVLSDAIDADDF